MAGPMYSQGETPGFFSDPVGWGKSKLPVGWPGSTAQPPPSPPPLGAAQPTLKQSTPSFAQLQAQPSQPQVQTQSIAQPSVAAAMPSMAEFFDVADKPQSAWKNMAEHFTQGFIGTAVPTAVGGILGGRKGAYAGAVQGMQDYKTEQAKDDAHKASLREKVLGDSKLVGAYYNALSKHPKDIEDLRTKVAAELGNEEFGKSLSGQMIKAYKDTHPGASDAEAINATVATVYGQQRSLVGARTAGMMATKAMPMTGISSEQDALVDPATGVPYPLSTRGKPIIPAGQTGVKAKVSTRTTGAASQFTQPGGGKVKTYNPTTGRIE